MSSTKRPVRSSPSRIDEAIVRLEREIAVHPGGIKTYYNLALLLIERSRQAEARAHLEKILHEAPNFAPAAFTLGRLALEAGDLATAERHLRVAAGAPALAQESCFFLAEALEKMERREEAATVLSWLIERHPPVPAPYIRLVYLTLAEAPQRALAVAETGISRFPRVAHLHLLRGHALLRLKNPDAAIDALRQALAIDPDFDPAVGYLLRAAREAARWDEEEKALALLRTAIRRPGWNRGLVISLHAALNFPFSGEELHLITERNLPFQTGSAVVPLPAAPLPAKDGPLVVGYLSPDYRDHAIAHLAADLFAAHDPARVRAVAFSEGPDDGSDIRRVIAAGARPFIDLRGLSDRDAAERIRAEGTHILVDLSLSTRFHRPGIAAHRPAPVQAAWLGLPCTSGAPWIDYLLADDIVAPAAHADRFVEKLVHLPCGYQPNRRLFSLPPPSGRAAEGLPEDATVFACFNAHLKIDRESFASWIEVLQGVPGSVLWLLEPPAAVGERYRAFTAERGVAPERLVFAPKRPRLEHLARLALADLMLDCLTYGAHTTCSDALRAGVPMLTVLGENFPARVGASILTHAGVPELVMPDRAAFVAEAIRLGKDAAARAALRQKLAVCVPASPVFDPAVQARALEDAFEAMWAKRGA
jgi:predicted O-linked N-acetylglucosamine transferase (SPINDLY family)